MAGIGAVNTASAAQVASPQQTARGVGQAELAISSQGNQQDTLTISSQGLQALDDSGVTLVVLTTTRVMSNGVVCLLLMT